MEESSTSKIFILVRYWRSPVPLQSVHFIYPKATPVSPSRARIMEPEPPQASQLPELSPRIPCKRLQELKPMTENISMSHNGMGGCNGAWKFDLQLDLFTIT